MLTGIESAKLKLVRATEHLEALKNCVLTYTGDEPSGVTRQLDGSFKVQFNVPPHPSIAILAGEIVYQIRSALDHLTFDLVKLNRKEILLPVSWDKRCEFPLLTKVPTTGNPPVACKLPLPYNHFRDTLPGIPEQAFAFIESVQPYYGTEIGLTMQWLVGLSQIDKHRYLNITNPMADIRYQIVTADGWTHKSFLRKQDGAEIKAPLSSLIDGAVQMQHSFTPYVAFDEEAVGLGPAYLPVDNILQLCLNVAQGIVVPAFEKFIKNP